MEAEAQLLLYPQRAAMPLLKLLRSAAANAKTLMKKETDALFIKEIRVDQGPKSARWMPRARGAMSPIERKTSHVTIVLGVAESSKPSRFTFARPKKRGPETPKKGKPHAHKKDKHEAGKDESKEKIRESGAPREEAKRGFVQRLFRRKAV